MSEQYMVAVLDTMYKKEYTGIEDVVKDVNGIMDYAIDLYNGISRNNEYCFGRKFDYSISIMQDRIIVSKECNDVKAKEAFLTFISLLQFLFIDEEIYLRGIIEYGSFYKSGDFLFSMSMPPFIQKNPKESYCIIVSAEALEGLTNIYVQEADKDKILSFMENVYRYNPFKDVEGNMMRHVITPLKKSIKKSQGDTELNTVVSICNAFSEKQGFVKQIIKY